MQTEQEVSRHEDMLICARLFVDNLEDLKFDLDEFKSEEFNNILSRELDNRCTNSDGETAEVTITRICDMVNLVNFAGL